MKTIHAVFTVSEDLYVSLASFGLTDERLVMESRKLLALKYFREKLLQRYIMKLSSKASTNQEAGLSKTPHGFTSNPLPTSARFIYSNAKSSV